MALLAGQAESAFVTRAVPPALRPYVGQAHGYRVPANPTGLHRGLPSRYLTLVVELLGPLRVAGPGGGVAAHGVVGGLHTGPVAIDASVPQEGLQYGLTPLGATALLGLPAAELRGLTVDLRDVLGQRADELVARLRAAPLWADRFGLVDTALLRLLPGEPPALSPEVAAAWRLVFTLGGRVRVAEVAERVGWSRRHLGERFRAQTGLTPKEAARVARFEAARHLLLSPGRPPLVDLALRCGYADTQHLAREWRALTGCSVTTWLAEELPFVHDTEGGGGAASLP